MREPAPHSSERVKIGDVGYFRGGHFHLLFYAGSPRGERELGADVPQTFEPLNVGFIVYSQPRPSGHLSTNTVKKPGVERSRMADPDYNILFEHRGKQGAILFTRYRTNKEDAQRESTFKAYTKRHYASWVTFAEDTGHGDNIKPVIVTGVDVTKDFSMMVYSNNGDSFTSRLSIPPAGSPSGLTWTTSYTDGVVHTNCGPQPRNPLPPTQSTDPIPSGNAAEIETVLDEYNQCLFIRGYTMRKRARVFPGVTRAAAGSHDLGPGGRDVEDPSEVGARSDSDSESDIVIHNTISVRPHYAFLPILSRSHRPSVG